MERHKAFNQAFDMVRPYMRDDLSKANKKGRYYYPRYEMGWNDCLITMGNKLAEILQAQEDSKEWEYGVIYFHPDVALREDLELVFEDCKGFITDILLNDIQQMMRKHGYDMKIYKKQPELA